MGVQDGPQRRALVVGVGSFKAWDHLEFVRERVHEVGDALHGADVVLNPS